MNTMEIQSLNREITNERVSISYPHVKLLEPSDAVALVLPELPKGDLPVLCEFNGTCRQIGSIMKSALVLDSLRKISKLQYCKTASDSMDILQARDAVEVLL